MTTLATIPALFAVALSISTTNDYHYVTIPTNMAASLTGVGMGSEASAEDAPLRYEDAAFLTEAYAERRYAYAPSAYNADKSPAGERYLDVAEAVKFYCDSADVFSFGDEPYFFYARPEAVAFSDDIKAIPHDTNTASNLWCGLFSTVTPAITSKGDLPFLFDGFGKGSPLRKSDVASLYEVLGKMSRPCLYAPKSLTPIDGICHTAHTEVDNASSWIRDYSSSSYEFVYGTDYSTNYVESATDAVNFGMSVKTTYTAAKQKYAGFVGETRYTDITPGHRTSTDIVKENYTDMVLVLDVRPSFAKLGKRKIKNASVFVVGRYYRLLWDDIASEDKFKDEQYFLARFDAEPLTAGEGTIFDVPLQTTEFDALAKKVTTLFGGTFYESADALLDAVPEPSDPTLEDSDHNEVDSDLKFVWEIVVKGFLVVLDVDFNARVMGGE